MPRRPDNTPPFALTRRPFPKPMITSCVERGEKARRPGLWRNASSNSESLSCGNMNPLQVTWTCKLLGLVWKSGPASIADRTGHRHGPRRGRHRRVDVCSLTYRRLVSTWHLRLHRYRWWAWWLMGTEWASRNLAPPASLNLWPDILNATNCAVEKRPPPCNCHTWLSLTVKKRSNRFLKSWTVHVTSFSGSSARSTDEVGQQLLQANIMIMIRFVVSCVTKNPLGHCSDQTLAFLATSNFRNSRHLIETQLHKLSHPIMSRIKGA